MEKYRGLYYPLSQETSSTYAMVESCYRSHRESFRVLESVFSADFDIPPSVVRDSIKRILVGAIEDKRYRSEVGLVKLHNYNTLYSFFLYHSVMMYFLVLSALGVGNIKKSERVDVLFDAADHAYPRFYGLLYEKLINYRIGLFRTSNEKKLPHRIIGINKIFNAVSIKTKFYTKKISLLILKKQFYRWFLYKRLTGVVGLDIVKISLQLQKHIAMFSTDMNGVTAGVIISSFHNAYDPIRYYIYKTKIDSILLIENGIGRTNKGSLCNGECYTYSDWYFYLNKGTNKTDWGLKSSKNICAGSILLDEALDKYGNKRIYYDILFIEAFITFESMTLSPEDYILCLEYLARFSIEYPKVRIGYRVRKDKRESNVYKNQEQLEYVNRYDAIISNSNILVDYEHSEDSYEAILKSNIIMFYVSSMGIEALAMGKNIFSMNLDKRFPAYFTSGDSMAVLYDKNYNKFKDKILFLLDLNNKALIDVFYGRLRNKIVCQEVKLHDKICKIVSGILAINNK